MLIRRHLVFILIALLCTVNAAAESVIGRLGQTTAGTTIHSSQSSKARVYYRANAYDYLIVRPAKSGTYWTPVVMEDGRLGYIRTSKVVVLPYNVTLDNVQQPSRSASKSRTPVAGTDARAQIARYSMEYIGTPYVWGGNDLNKGIDCSGFVQQLYGSIGVSLPRTAREQALVGKKIERKEDLLPGDRLYFWDSKRGRIGHTGIYLGNGYFCHSSTNNHGVATDDLRNPKWEKMLVAARR